MISLQRLSFLCILLVLLSFGFKTTEATEKKRTKLTINSELSRLSTLHNDSIHSLNFRYHDKKRGLKPYIAPSLIIGTGTALHFSKNIKYNFQNWVQSKTNYNGKADDFLPHAPLAAVYSLNALGIKGKNNFGNRTALVAKSYLLNAFLVKSLKTVTNVERPNGENESFPSGHSSVAFVMAHFMHKEYGEQSAWYSIGAYACATSVAALRVAKNEHWISDVITGAGIGILSTELIYLTHLYKWDNEHLKNWDIFPFKTREHKGLTLVYHF